MLKIGVLGAGHLGRIHIKLLKEIEHVELVGFYDPHDENANRAVDEYGVKRFPSIESILDMADAIDIVTPTLSHFECAKQAIVQGKHVFIEKPITNTLEEAEKLMKLSQEANVKGQVGHVERFNPAYLSCANLDIDPVFIETHRLAVFNPRGTDVSVVLDLMIHDIDIILSLVDSSVQKISANGVAVISDSPDIANVRLEFANGCVANLTASRISLKNMRKTRIFQKNAYITMDFLEKKASMTQLYDEKPNDDELAMELKLGDQGPTKYIRYIEADAKPVNAIQLELEHFRDAILNDGETPVTISDGYQALKVAHDILKIINRNNFDQL